MRLLLTTILVFATPWAAMAQKIQPPCAVIRSRTSVPMAGWTVLDSSEWTIEQTFNEVLSRIEP